jgi:hypothetical protein
MALLINISWKQRLEAPYVAILRVLSPGWNSSTCSFRCLVPSTYGLCARLWANEWVRYDPGPYCPLEEEPRQHKQVIWFPLKAHKVCSPALFVVACTSIGTGRLLTWACRREIPQQTKWLKSVESQKFSSYTMWVVMANDICPWNVAFICTAIQGLSCYAHTPSEDSSSEMP